MTVPSAPILGDCDTLDDLWLHVSELNRTHFPTNELQPILGGGKTFRPNIMFIFINPTAANISSDRNWGGPRFPFIGTRHVWKVFYQSGLIDQRLMDRINDGWSPRFAEDVLRLLEKKSFYLTNIVKWTGPDGTLPNSDKIKLFLPVLKREIELVKPEYIVTFGLIPFEKLTSLKIRLSDYHASVLRNKRLEHFDISINSTKSKVVPCYFPVGRGDPKKATDILRFVNKL
jgi:DNA polymerase